MQLVTPLRPSWPPISDPSSPPCGLAQKMLQGQGWLFKHLPYDSYAVRHGARMQTPSPYKDQLPICPKPLKSEALPRCKPECLTLKRILQTWPSAWSSRAQASEAFASPASAQLQLFCQFMAPWSCLPDLRGKTRKSSHLNAKWKMWKCPRTSQRKLPDPQNVKTFPVHLRLYGTLNAKFGSEKATHVLLLFLLSATKLLRIPPASFQSGIDCSANAHLGVESP